MSITMYQSDRNFVTPANDASLYAAISGDTSGVLKRGNGLKITVNGLTATVDTGQAVVLGRLIEVTEPVSFTLPGSSSGNIVIVIDLSKANTVVGQAGTPNYQIKVNQVYMAGVTGNLVQEDINNGGYIYQLPLATFTTTATTASVKQSNPMLNDTGWLNLNLADSHSRLVGNPSYAQYRVRDNVVFIRWRGVDVTSADNGNQIGRVPWAYRPDVEIVTTSANLSNGSVSPVVTFLNDTTTIWVITNDNNRNNLAGSMSYPLPNR